MSEANGRGPILVGQEPPPLHQAEPATPRPGKGAGRGKTGERFAMLNAFTDFTLAKLTRTETALWLILFRDSREGMARTAYDDLARRAGCNRRNVGRGLRQLERLGLVKIVRRGGLRQGASSYRLRPLAKDG